MDRRSLVCLILAALLLIPIVLSAVRLSEITDDDDRLSEVEIDVIEGNAPRALRALRELQSVSRLTGKQAAFRDDLTLRAVVDALERNAPRLSAGAYDIDTENASDLVFNTRSVRVSAEIGTPQLVGVVCAIRFGSVEIPLEEARVSLLVDLPETGEARTLDVTAVIALADGSRHEHTLGGSMSLRFDGGGASFSVRIGDGAGIPPSAQGSTTLLVPPGRPVTVEVNDERGLKTITWKSGQDGDTRQFLTELDTRSHKLTLPDRVAKKAGRHSVEVMAENRLGTKATRTFTIDVKDDRWLPVTEVRLSDTVLNKPEIVIRGTDHRLVAILETGVPADSVGIAVRTDSGTYPLRPDGDHLATEVKLNPLGKTGISLVRGNATLKTWTVRTDAAAPVVAMRVDGKPLRPGSDVVLEPGTAVEFVVEDANGIATVVFESGRLRVDSKDQTRTTWTRHLRVTELVRETVTLKATDVLGNTTDELRWNIRARQPISIRTIKVQGIDVGLDAIAVTSDTVQVTMETGGEGLMTWALTDPDDQRVLGKGEVAADLRGVSVTVPLGVVVGGVAKRALRFADKVGDRHLVTAQLRVDRVPPRVRIGDWDPDRDGPREKFEATPGTRLEIRVEEAGGDVEVTVTGSVILSRDKKGDTVTLVVGVPETLPAPMVVRAKDAAGNVTGLAFTVVKPTRVAAVTVDLVHEGEVVQHDGPVMLKRPRDLSITVKNGTVARVSLGGTDLPVGTDGQLVDPASPPGEGPLVVVVRDLAGEEREIRFLVQLVPYAVPQALRDRLAKARRDLKDGRKNDALKAAADLEEEVKTQSREHLISKEAGHFLVEIRSLKEEGGGGRGAADRSSLPPILVNGRDGARLLLVKAGSAASGFAPIYLYEREVTAEMYRRFLDAVGDDQAFWAALPDPLDIRRPLERPETARQDARRLIGPRTSARRPVSGVSPAIALAYVRWASKGLKGGKLGIPTVGQWTLAAGRAVHPGAIYPSTGAFPDGSDLKGVTAIGAGGGAAFGYRGREVPKASGSYAPGAFGLLDMAGNLWELVRNDRNRWFVIGGAITSKREGCQLDKPQPVDRNSRGLTGLRPIWIPNR